MLTREEINWNDKNIEVEEYGGVKKLFWMNPDWFYNEMADRGWQAGIPRGVEKWVDSDGNDITEEMAPVMSVGQTMNSMLCESNLYHVFLNAYRRLACGEYKQDFEEWKKQRIEEEYAAGNQYPYPYIGWRDGSKRECYKEWGSTRFGRDIEILTDNDFHGALYRCNISNFDNYRATLVAAAEKYNLNENFPGLAMARFGNWREYLKTVA